MSLWIIALCMVCSSAHADDIINPVAGTQTEIRTMRSGLQRRDVLIIKPRGSDAQGPRPALVLLSYLGGSPGPMANLTAAAKLARDHQFYVLVPQAIRGRWNSTESFFRLVDDIKFLNQVIDMATADLPVDPDRVFMAGYSNGGRMTYTYACAQTQRLAGAAAVGTAFSKNTMEQCSPGATLPFLILHGDADPILPYDGSRGDLSSPAAARFWAQSNGCESEPVRTEFPDTVDDGTSTLVDTYNGCRDNARVLLYTIHNGGHTWPGIPEAQPVLGRTGQDIDATDTLGRVFSELSRP